jgi:hypothetical protein
MQEYKIIISLLCVCTTIKDIQNVRNAFSEEMYSIFWRVLSPVILTYFELDRPILQILAITKSIALEKKV